jgi:hypothetical protein
MLGTSKTNQVAYMSNGSGGFVKDGYLKPTQVHLLIQHKATADTPKDANGMFNGCPTPKTCWVPKLVAGKEWQPISQYAS